jgi:hypothetical protein
MDTNVYGGRRMPNPTEVGTLMSECAKCGLFTYATLNGAPCYGSDADFCAWCGEGFESNDRRVFDGGAWVEWRVGGNT